MSDTALADPTRSEPTAPGQDDQARLPHNPALDGIRAIAVLAVLLYHHFTIRDVTEVTGGFLGVDIFFVLSGFLITTLLLIDHERTGKVVSWRFWERRLRRLLPAALLLLLIVAIYAQTMASSFRLGALRRSALATLLYVQNYWQLYGDGDIPLILGHTWSLAIEEQFYLVWPVALAGLVWACRRRPRALPWAIGALALASAARMAAVYHPKSPWRAYLGLDTRSHELLVGALLAVVMLRARHLRTPRWAVRALEAVGAACLVWLLSLFLTAHYNDAWLFRGGFLLVSLATAVLIAAVMQPEPNLLRSVLGWRPLAAIGLISYGLYLFHIPVYLFIDTEHTGLDGVPLGVARFAATFALAIASYVVVEQPVRMRAAWLPSMRILAPAAIAVTVAAVLLSTMGATAPPDSTKLGLAYFSYARSAPEGSTRVLYAGDAIAFALGTSGRVPYTGRGIHGVSVTEPGCGLARGVIVEGDARVPGFKCGQQTIRFGQAARAFAPHVVVLAFDASEPFSHEVDDRLLEFGSPAYERYLHARLDALREVLTEGGAATVLLTTPCMEPVEGGFYPALNPGRADPERLAWLNGVWRNYAADHPDVTLADLDAFLCVDGMRRVDPVAGPLGAPDGVTLSDAGARALWEWLAPIAVAARPDQRVDPPYGGD